MPENRVAAGPAPDINSAIALASMVFLAVVGPQAVVVQPAFVEGLVSQLGFDQVTYATAMQMIGIASGPAIAARILEVGGAYHHIMLAAVLFLLLTLACILPPVIRHAAQTRLEQD